TTTTTTPATTTTTPTTTTTTPKIIIGDIISHLARPMLLANRSEHLPLIITSFYLFIPCFDTCK
ncbi:uncharacterized protein LOC110441966, partial [Mizuhopecten yessoensis]|uniref:uncharacterized protein LOC110441966 n=1 Tax=Mizuhopecten yessoensis TaxID=6573 RepID=UPI000B45BBD4